MALHPNTSRGYAAELAVAAMLLEAGFEVALPYGAHAYDLLARPPKAPRAKREGRWLKIQVKLASPRSKRKNFHTDLRHPGRKRQHYTKDEVDFFICWRAKDAAFWVLGLSGVVRVSLDEQTPGYRDLHELLKRK